MTLIDLHEDVNTELVGGGEALGALSAPVLALSVEGADVLAYQGILAKRLEEKRML